MRSIFCLTVCILFFCICVSKGVAEETVNMVTTNWPPFYSEKLLSGGPLTEASSEAFKRVGYKMEIKYIPWKRALSYVEYGKADALLGAYKNEERKKFSYYSESIIGETTTSIIALKDSPITYDSLDSLKRYKIGILIGTSVSKEFDSVKNEFLKIFESSSESQLIKMLENGRVDLIAGSLQVFFSEYKILYPDRDPSNYLKSITILSSEAMYNIFSKKLKNGKDLRDAFDRGFKMIVEDGTFEKIMKKHGIK